MPYVPPDDRQRPDILHRLRFYADHVGVAPEAELEAMLREAATDIAELRQLVGIREEVWLEDVELEGMLN